MKTILITGSSGFIGKYLAINFKSGYKVIGIDLDNSSNLICDKFYLGNICDSDIISKIFIENNIDYIIHAAAIKSLNLCEKNKELALDVNYEATKKLYNIAKKHKSKFLYLSSDIIFNGNSGYHEEYSKKNPINYYGITKAMCEDLLMNDPDVAICRTAMVFGRVPKNQKYLFNKIKDYTTLQVQGFIIDHIIYKLKNKNNILLSNDEFCNPTSVDLLFRQIRRIIEFNINGIIHCCGGERISKYEFGEKIATFFNLDSKLILPIKSNDSLRPKDVSMNFKESEDKLDMIFDDVLTMLEMGRIKKNENIY